MKKICTKKKTFTKRKLKYKSITGVVGIIASYKYKVNMKGTTRYASSMELYERGNCKVKVVGTM